MAKIGTLREAFDRDYNFVAVRPIKLNGVQIGPGQPFDKTKVTTRRLRQLYDARFLRMAEPDFTEQREPTPRPVVDLGNMVPPETPPKGRVKRVKLQQAAS